MPRETKPTPRTLFMEFKMVPGELPEHMQKPLEQQLGIEGGNWPAGYKDGLTVLVQVRTATGGPKAVIGEHAKAPGVFRAVATDALGPRKNMKPPPANQLVMEDLD